MFKTFTLSFLLVALSYQQCGLGCLKCNSQNNCVICDISNFYVLANSTCTQITARNNCAIFRSSGACFACNSNFYLDSNTNKCVAVPTLKVVAQCSTYDGNQNCAACASGYYINGANCTAVNVTVANCNTYKSNGVCAVCNSGYIFNIDNTACVAPPAIQGCGSYTYLSCGACGSGYVNNANNYFTQLSGNSSFIENLYLNQATNNNTSSWSGLAVCQQIAIQNCLVYLSYNQCATCAAGYYLSAARQCVAFPAPVISGCLTYFNTTTCASCVVGRHFGDSTQTSCVADIAITNCVTYNNTAISTTSCIACSVPNYLSAANTCSPRVNSINLGNCIAYNATSDQCSICTVGFQITADGLLCSTAIPNCATYSASSSKSNGTQTCDVCANTFTVSANKGACIVGPVTNCITYSTSGVCSGCDTSKYYLNTTSNQCIAHNSITRCVDYSGAVANTCATCQAGYYPFTIGTVCQSSPLIANCQTGASTLLTSNVPGCAVCNPGFYLTSGGAACTANPTGFENCASYNSGTNRCNVCTGNNVVAVNGKCVSPFGFLIANCQNVTYVGATNSLALINVVDGTSQSYCAVCNQGSAPISLANDYVCFEQSRFNDIGNTSPNTNCLRYVVTGGTAVLPTYACAECFPDFFLSAANTCTAYTSSATAPACTNGYLLVDNLVDGIVNSCVPAAGTPPPSNNFGGCAIAGRVDVSSANLFPYTASNTIESDLRCIRVSTTNPGYFLLSSTALTTPETVPNSYRPMDPTDTVTLNIKPVFRYQRYGFGVTTTAPSTGGGTPTSSVVTGCEVYTSSGNQCAKCKFGYALTGTSSTVATCTNLVTGCATGTFLGGLQSPITGLTSCHVCSAAGQIVQVNALMSSTSPFTWSVPPYAANVATVTCINTPSTATVPANCAMVASDQTASTAIPIYCIACKPGFSATLSTGNAAYPFQVSACTAIASCDTSDVKTPFNGCSTCTSTAAAPTALDETTYAACVPLAGVLATANCLLSSTNAGGATPACTVCKPGYYLNADKICETFTLTSCSDTASTLAPALTTGNPLSDPVNYRNRYLALSAWGAWPFGCRRCNSYNTANAASFIGIKFPRTSGLTTCEASNYIGTTITSTTTNYVANCLQYSATFAPIGSPITCAQCNANFILTTDARRCVATKANCLIADTSSVATNTVCSICASGYVLTTGGVCSAITISNCRIATFTSGAQVCTTCANGYYLGTSGTSCVFGSVANCQTYTAQSATSCTSCFSGFTLVAVSGASYCLPIDNSFNCLTFDSGASSTNGFANRIYSCTSCVNTATAAYVLKTYNATAAGVVNICQSLYNVPNCATYSASSAATTLSTVTLACATCNTGFYLSAPFNCTARSASVINCTTFNNTADACSVCSAGYFANSTTGLCNAFPSGVINCSNYTNGTTCAACSGANYLSNGACVASTPIIGCASYTANYTCGACSSGYFLTNSTFCDVGTVSNCVTFASKTSCSVCAAGYGILASNGVNTCVSNALPNCQASTTVSPFSCLLCNTGYYINQGNCTGVTSPVANCATYDSATTCSQCNQPYVLTVNKTLCTQAYQLQTDVNCASTSVSATATCAQCALGSYFSNGTCTACANSASGCLSCDPTNTTTCFACRPSYYQVSNGTCIANGQTGGNGGTPTNTNTTTPSSNASIASVFAVLALLLAWFF